MGTADAGRNGETKKEKSKQVANGHQQPKGKSKSYSSCFMCKSTLGKEVSDAGEGLCVGSQRKW